jgi:hypothetical protein
MKMIAATATFVALAALSAAAQPLPQTGKPGPVCIRPFDTPTGSIDHTHVVDARTVLFFMRGGKIWKNTLHSPCRGLLLHGFSFLTRQDEICSNAQAIQVVETGEVCQLGEFTPYVATAQP